MDRREQYIGDAVHASFDGFQIKLYCVAPEAVIYLEPAVLIALIDYAVQCGMLQKQNA